MRTTNGTEVLIGCDPEFFLYSPRAKRNVSAHRLIPGDKKNPHKVDGGAIQVDGTAVEFNIDAASTAEQFEANVKKVLGHLRKTIPEKYEFQFKPAIYYPQEYFDKLPARTKELGCDPDYNAYTGATNPRPPADKVGTMRTGSGHIHIGWTKDADIEDPSHIWDCRQLVKTLDQFFIQYSHFWDNDVDRRRLYGNYGAFRPKSYGVEYRVLSNAWLAHPEIYQWLFTSCVAVFDFLERGNMLRSYRMPSLNSLKIARSYYPEDVWLSRYDANYNPFYYSTLPKSPKVAGWTSAFSEKVLKPEYYQLPNQPANVNWI